MVKSVAWEHIPRELSVIPRWVVWKWEMRDGKKTKPPYSAKTGGKASSTDPATWCEFAHALAAYRDGPYDGIGLVVTDEDNLIGVDLDHCVNPDTGEVAPWAQSMVDLLQTYTETSPSGTGLRAWVYGTLPATGRKKGDVELYTTGRYLTVTGNVYGPVVSVHERGEAVLALHASVWPPVVTNGNGSRPILAPVELADAPLLDKMFHATNGAKVRALWQGDTNGYPSASEADLALAAHLAFWCGRDEARMDRLFRQSGLMRDKWDSTRGSSTYGADTLARACAACRESYSGGGAPSPPPMADDAPTNSDPCASKSEAAFQLVTPPGSFITRYVEYAAMRTDAPLEAHEALAFGILSALAGPSVALPIATAVKGWRLTLWLLYLVNSTVGRKSTTLDLAVDVVRAVLGESALIHWEGSPQGLLQRLQTRDGQASVFVRDEYSGLMAGMNRGGHLAGLPQLLIKGYDGAVLENVRTRKRGPDGDTHSDTDRVEDPYLLQFAAAPWDAFTERATIDNVLDGFLARFLIVMGSASERELPMLTEAIRSAGTAVYDQARHYHARAQAVQQVAIAPDVLARQWALEQDYRRRAQASSRPDAAGPSLKRLAETALKLSALLALEEETGTIVSIREAHFLLAVQITDKWAGNALRLIEALGRTTFQRDCEAVLRTIQQRPAGIPKGQLYRLHQRLRQRDFEEILGALETQERIAIEKTESSGRGRPPLTVKALRVRD
jgi:hypothetical protein